MQTVGTKDFLDDTQNYLDEALDETVDDLSYTTYSTAEQIDDTEVNNDLIRAIIDERIYCNQSVRGNTLIFLPGAYEIQKLQDYLVKCFENEFEILCCYSQLPLEEQQKLFRHSTKNRIILATNIAEASITIPNVIAVIDTGLERKVSYQAK